MMLAAMLRAMKSRGHNSSFIGLGDALSGEASRSAGESSARGSFVSMQTGQRQAVQALDGKTAADADDVENIPYINAVISESDLD